MRGVRVGALVFTPSLAGTALVVVLAALFVRLGLWQWHRGVEREAQWARFARGADRLVDLDADEATSVPLYQRVSVSGALDGAHQFLLDNRIFHGHAGFEVLTPLVRSPLPTLLVDRGWVPLVGRRTHLPQVTVQVPGQVKLTGRLAALPAPGLPSGRAPPPLLGPWPKVTSYPRVDELAAALGARLAPRILLLDPRSPYGYERDWQPPGLPPLRHFGYALQWWSFAVLALGTGLVMSLRRPREPPAR